MEKKDRGMMIQNFLFGSVIFCILMTVFILGFTNQRSYLVYLLVFSLLLGPRIPFGMITEMQRLDVRLDDIIILIMFLIGIVLFLTRKVKIQYPHYMYFLSLFVIASFLSSILGSLLNGFSLLYSFLFWGKEVEYILLAFLVPLFIKRDESLISIFRIFCFAMVLNIGWLFWQIVSGVKGQLIEIVHVPSYGFALIGESQVSEVASVYSLSLIIFTALFFFYKRNIIIIFLMIGSLIGLISTLSRTFILSTFVSFWILSTLYLVKKFSLKNIAVYTLLLLIVLFSIKKSFNFLLEKELPVFRLQLNVAEEALQNVRKEEIWEPLWNYFLKNKIIGYGKGHIRELIYIFDEAHNYYLRLLVEIGLIGFIIFILFLFFLAKTAFNLFKSPIKEEYNFIALNMLLLIITVSVASIGQDAFYASKVAIPFYSNVGLLNYVYRRKR